MKHPFKSSLPRGLTLPEMLIVLLVAGVAIVVAAQLTSRSANQSAAGQDEALLDRAQDALLGYARVHLHLPAPQDDGLPDSISANLGSNRIRYFTSPALTTVPRDRYDPHGLLGRTAASEANGLDLCLRLAHLADGDLIPFGTGASAPQVAVVLEYSSAGPTAKASQEVALPGTSLAASRWQQGRVSRGLGVGELFAALNCADRVSRTAAAAKYQWAMQDMLRLAQANTALKRYDLEVALAQHAASEVGRAQMVLGQVLGAMDFANYQLGFLGSLPKADYAGWAIDSSVMAGSMAVNAIRLALINETLDHWPDAKAGLDAAIDLAVTQETAVGQALADARNEHLNFQRLGFTR